jgi:hypothetical protein
MARDTKIIEKDYQQNSNSKTDEKMIDSKKGIPAENI